MRGWIHALLLLCVSTHTWWCDMCACVLFDALRLRIYWCEWNVLTQKSPRRNLCTYGSTCTEICSYGPLWISMWCVVLCCLNRIMSKSQLQYRVLVLKWLDIQPNDTIKKEEDPTALTIEIYSTRAVDCTVLLQFYTVCQLDFWIAATRCASVNLQISKRHKRIKISNWILWTPLRRRKWIYDDSFEGEQRI